ncbi:MAG: hypothetical protein IJA94_06615 [Bacilli bacterium]|nr:hypothetical protein [Bacilli bacterium]MBQ3415300.1 hypothetical protein [Clostridia bacterium]MBQ4584543.1 hypothetical protein [Bacilli bacterium]MBR0058204.1 hypothetical protein [Methanobrevibacter sp.]MBR0371548.1 hypothetical protein [Methanobrevibacter sp.]
MKDNYFDIDKVVVIKQLPEIMEQLDIISAMVDEKLADIENIKCTEENKIEVKNRRAEINNTLKILEEEEYIKKARYEYLEEENKNVWSFLMSDKARKKNIQYVTDRARERYRQNKLEEYEEEIKEERKRIDKVVEEINNKLNEWLKKQKNCISSNVKPLNIKVRPYSTYNIDLTEALEVITIKCDPLEISFIQEKLGSEDNETN